MNSKLVDFRCASMNYCFNLIANIPSWLGLSVFYIEILYEHFSDPAAIPVSTKTKTGGGFLLALKNQYNAFNLFKREFQS